MIAMVYVFLRFPSGEVSHPEHKDKRTRTHIQEWNRAKKVVGVTPKNVKFPPLCLCRLFQVRDESRILMFSVL